MSSVILLGAFQCTQ